MKFKSDLELTIERENLSTAFACGLISIEDYYFAAFQIENERLRRDMAEASDKVIIQ